MPSPYERAPRDQRNKRDRDTTSTTYHPVISRRPSHSQPQTELRKNLKESAQDLLRACVAPPESFDPLNNSCEPVDNADCFWASDQDNQMSMTKSSPDRQHQSGILDRWAARQARQMITSIERQAHEAELLALSSSHTVSTMASSFLRETSPAPSEGSMVDVPNLRASSLVQMWKELEAEARLSIDNQRNSGNSGISNRANSMEEPSGSSEVCEDDGFTDWESDMMTPRSDLHSSLQDPVSDVGESETGRVADIIRRLTSANHTQSSFTSWSDEIDQDQSLVSEALSRNQSLSRNRSMSDHGDNAGFIFGENRPRIRGRHAITDLLVRIERERQRELARLGERRAVSRFPQRSRIQSFLRLKILKCEVGVRHHQRRASTASELDQLQRGSTILLLRERFSSRARPDSGTAPIEDSQTRVTLPTPTNSLDSDHSRVSDQPMTEDGQYQEVAAGDCAKEAPVPLPLPSTSEDLQEEASPSSEAAWQERSLLISNLDWHGTSNTATSHDWEGEVVMEEAESDTQQNLGHTDGTWVGDASRPQRDWEGRRREMYCDWLENNSDNLEIRELLERRSVSNSLASDFRHRMDRLIISYLQRQGHRPIDESSGEEEEEHHPVLQQNHEVSDFDQASPGSIQLPLPTRLSHHQESLQFSSFVDRASHRSLEMEFIYDLRGDIARIHHEMCELRKTIESCVDMQMKLQRSVKQEVSAGVCHSAESEETLNSPNWVPISKGSCCICYEVQVDSLLYRCGHMCTCFKCAQELQWSSGRCPICRAPIMDVVHAYSNS